MSRGTTLAKKRRQFMKDADVFVGQLARDLYVARYGKGEAVPEDAMRAAVAYFQALQTFGKPSPMPPPEAREAVLAEDERLEREGEGRELARDAYDANGTPVAE